MYEIVDQVPNGLSGQWITADPESAKAPAQPHGQAAFTLNRRSFPTLSTDDDYIYINLHDPNLLDGLRKVFPSVGTLYQAQAGVGPRAGFISELGKAS